MTINSSGPASADAAPSSHSQEQKEAQKQPEPEPRKLKILMLHGYTQSGPLFHLKTRALEKLLHKAFPPSTPPPSSNPQSHPNPRKPTRPPPPPALPSYPGGIQLFYPTAPIKLHPADIPGFTPSDLEGGNGDNEESEAYGWWKRETGSGKYIGLEEGFDTIAKTIREVGGVDAVIGFSQGGAAAAMVTSLLEPGRQQNFQDYLAKSPEAFQYPASFKDLGRLCNSGNGLLFAVSYSGFYTPSPLYTPFYSPKIKTRVLNVIGSLDSVVEESRSGGLADRCEEVGRQVVRHPGGHFVPVNKEMGGVLVGWIRECCVEKEGEGEEGLGEDEFPF